MIKTPSTRGLPAFAKYGKAFAELMNPMIKSAMASAARAVIVTTSMQIVKNKALRLQLS